MWKDDLHPILFLGPIPQHIIHISSIDVFSKNLNFFSVCMCILTVMF